jgi:predicted ATP-grasp superfamily ATP-dependent carboligase
MAYTANSCIIAEQFIEGIEIGGDALVANGELLFHGTTLKKTNEFFVPYAHLVPAPLNEVEQSQIRSLLQEVIEVLGLKHGNLNFDIMLKEEKAFLLDLGLRLGGNGIPELLSYATGYPLLQHSIENALGKAIPGVTQPESKAAAVYIFGSRKAAIIHELKPIEDVLPSHKPHLRLLRKNFRAGQPAEPFTHSGTNVGYAIFSHNSFSEIEALITKVHQQDWIIQA